MRRSLVLAAAVLALALPPSAAPAVPGALTITLGGRFIPGDERPHPVTVGPYAVDTVVLPLVQRAGDDLLFANRDVEGHNITSEARDENDIPLFSTETIDRSEVVVVTTSHLSPGDYPFFCSVHPFMNATLSVV